MAQTKKNYKKLIVILLVIVIFVILFAFFKSNKKFFNDNLIFFKLFDSGLFNQFATKDDEVIANKQINLENSSELFFHVEYDNTDFKKINLADTINKDTLVEEKIAPGTKGNFKIFLLSNKDIEYTINFISLNSKPKNLFFEIEGRNEEYQSLEDLQDDLIGSINENEVKTISINWYWKYDNNSKEDVQDTKDGREIQKYNFEILVSGVY